MGAAQRSGGDSDDGLAGMQASANLLLRLQPGYDHSYYFIASFIADHVAHHAGALRS